MKLMSQTIGLAVLLALPMPLFAQSNAFVAPLPPIGLVLQRAMEESRRENDLEHAFKQHYSYTRTRVTEYRSSDGDLKSREEKTNVSQPRATPPAHPMQTTGRAPVAPPAGATL